MAKDNTTIELKVALRKQLLKEVHDPIVLETHGGYGNVWKRCYSHIDNGIVFETDPEKASILSAQRQTWAVYQSDCIKGIKCGIGADANYIDIDPYGNPWEIIDAVILTNKNDSICIAVNDGLRQGLQRKAGWNIESISSLLLKYGNQALYKNYLAYCKEFFVDKAEGVGYKVKKWTSYYCGHNDLMTHYGAVLERD